MYVYETKNLINGKKYIGVCVTKNEKKSKKYLGSGKLLVRAIKKYGRENFEKNIIKVFDNENDAREYERYLISEKNAVDSDDYYNLTDGGYGGFSKECRKISDETKEKISKSNKGKKMPKSQLISMSYVTLKYDLNGIFIEEYPSKSEAERQNNIKLTGIEKGVIHHTGFLWKYKDGNYDNIEPYSKMLEIYSIENSKRNSKLREDEVLNLIFDYNNNKLSYDKLSNKYGISKSCVSDIIKGKTYKWVSR
jgi:hypothetical protein